jgi:methionyl-tRNA formyltransferase
MITDVKIIVITNGNYFARIILDQLLTDHQHEVCGVLIISGDYKARRGLVSLAAIGKVTAPEYLIYKIITIAFYKIVQRLYYRKSYSVKSLADRLSISVYETHDVNSEAAYRWVAAFSPELLVSVSCPQMIHTKLLSAARLGGINIHSSLLPAYAGLAPYFWVLSAGEKITGTTVHYMTQKFDEGNILVQEQLDVIPGESSQHLFVRLATLGNRALPRAVEMALAGEAGTKQDMSAYSYFSNPDRKSYLRLRRNGHCLARIQDYLANF